MEQLPPLTELRAFEAAGRHLSFKQAASELGVTPTAISHQIRLLEQFCGRPLFRRRPRPLSLTPAGEHLLTVVREGLTSFATVLGQIRDPYGRRPLRVTATNAFAGRWLVPRLPLWRAAHPDLALDVIGTDAVIDIRAGETDVAIRYARTPPTGLVSHELCRDAFRVTCCPSILVAEKPIRTPADLLQYPLVDQSWPDADSEAPTWQQFRLIAAQEYENVPELAGATVLSFREELHAMEAVIAGQGLAILSNVLVGPELRSGRLVTVLNIELPGYGFYFSYPEAQARRRDIKALLAWMQSVM
jgi:LysR family glycine cleavage system transcriptional activator